MPSKPIFDPEFWRQRISEAHDFGELHRSIYWCSEGTWNQISETHRRILAERIKPDDVILDAGCGWGRLLDLLPKEWKGDYIGVDLSPDFIEMARKLYPNRMFVLGDMRDILPRFADNEFDWGVTISVDIMIQHNAGLGVWKQIESELTRTCVNLLPLEYVHD